ncbi:MAG TPA: methyltransferase domain-containing protein, partial [Spirochaetota bacterium]|nr:methyltransferase domain-containing protein [Spirochaetota bacterium]
MSKCNFGNMKDLCDVHEKGSSSFKMHDSKKVFEEIDLKKGEIALDLGCGPGDYSFEMANIVGDAGKVYSIEKDQEIVSYLNERIKKSGIKNIYTFCASIAEPLPIENESADLCLIVTVLHIPAVSKSYDAIFTEVNRILKKGGRLITIDVKKEDASFGPPMNMRISSDELKDIVVK